MADIASLGLAVDSSQVEHGTVTLTQLTGAAGTAERAVRGLAGAGQAEAAGMKVATAATQAHTAALNVNNAAMRAGAAQRTNLIFQLNDVGVSLASGMNPLLVAVQQGSQIFQGGFSSAVKGLGELVAGLVTKFWPLIVVIGLVSAAIAGVQNEINKTADVQVGFFDVALAGWQLFTEAIGSLVAPVFAQLGTWLQQGWDIAAPILKNIGNAIIGTFVAAFDAIGAVWSNLPAALGDWAYQGAQAVIDAFTIMAQQVVASLNGLLISINDKFGAMGVNLPTLGEPYKAVPGMVLDNPYKGSGDKLNSGVSDAIGGAYDRDYLGDAYNAISGRAQEIAAAKGALDEVGGAANAANDNVKKLADDGLSAAAKAAKEFGNIIKDAFKGFISDLRDGKSWIEALSNALGSLGDRFLDLALDAVFGGAGQGGGIFGAIASLFGFANGGVFNSGQQVHAYAQGGVVTKPTMFPMANGAGLMGEAGPEAIMPLRRGPDGRLGVSAANQNGGGVIQVQATMQVVNGNLVPVITEVAGQVSGQKIVQAAPTIIGASVSQANKSAPGALARYQTQESGSDYRVG